MRDEDVVAAARAVRSDLPTLVGDVHSAFLERELAAMLARADNGEPVADDILDLLTPHDRVLVRLRDLLPATPDAERGLDSGALGTTYSSAHFSQLPGVAAPTAEILYRCGFCDYAYPVFEAGEPVPESCPDGHGPLTTRR
ncbi:MULTISPECIES: hypothetical protein [Actinosynnema]|uniref:hypothetical protein n=1 Tax=Actinosynnema TaxID=40566 RepID=UPI0020A286A5|nr:hypothetical protein [Actinosynnema pretiosum]MCP2094733.1 hypothetical protein [Actinosynnema pretiosum]